MFHLMLEALPERFEPRSLPINSLTTEAIDNLAMQIILDNVEILSYSP